MMTVTVYFPHHASQQTELRSARGYAGSPVTITVTFPRLPTQAATLLWNAEWKTYETATIRFRNDYHHLTTASICYNYD